MDLWMTLSGMTLHALTELRKAKEIIIKRSSSNLSILIYRLKRHDKVAFFRPFYDKEVRIRMSCSFFI